MKPVYIDCSDTMRRLLVESGAYERLEVFDAHPTPQETMQRIANAQIVLNGHSVMDEATLRSAPQLRSIIFLGTGASSYIDVEAADRLGIRVRTIRGYGDRTVAEHAFALLLMAARNGARMDREIRAGVWTTREGLELKGCTLGLLGLGGIGQEMACIARGFGMRVIAWSRSGVPPGLDVEFADVDTVLAKADAVSLHLALTLETRGFLDAARISRMKRGAIFVNTARGALVDEGALVVALQSGHLAHAALDVFDTEPLSAGHPLTSLDNVTLTAHAGWKSEAAARRLLKMALDILEEDVRTLAAGSPLLD
jgi:D-3-phosphoglycerate dehydrogenase